MKNNNSVEIAVINYDVVSFDSDVLVLKYAQAHFGLDRFISQKLIRLGVDDTLFSPLPGIANYFNSRGGISASNVLIVGVKPLYDFNYKDIRSFARTALESLIDQEASIQHVCLTLHGANYGLDEIEAFESEVAGLIDGITGGRFPKEIRKISIIEIDKKRADRLNKTLTELIPKGYIEVNLKSYLRDVKQEVSEKFRSVGYSSSDKPYIFIAMPFLAEMEDVYDYGISNAVRKSGFLCERADLSVFTGDVMDWVKKRIKSASLVVADLTTANANVYVEVGYAWGSGVQTILLVQQAAQLKFDVRSQRCIVYTRIKELEEKLHNELISLKYATID